MNWLPKETVSQSWNNNTLLLTPNLVWEFNHGMTSYSSSTRHVILLMDGTPSEDIPSTNADQYLLSDLEGCLEPQMF